MVGKKKKATTSSANVPKQISKKSKIIQKESTSMELAFKKAGLDIAVLTAII